MATELVKGFRDILPEEALKREKVRQIITETCKKYGFLPLETPTIEYEELVKGDNELDEAVSTIYKLKDRAERKLALRYEFTFQLSRLLAENSNLKLPLRRYQTGSVFRDEPIGVGRYREFTQFDIDIIGDESIKADAEILAVVSEIFKKLGIKIEIVVNNRKLLNSIISSLGIENKEFAIREIDKIDKLGEDEVKKNLNKFIDKPTIIKLLSLFRKPLSYFASQKLQGSEELRELEKLCKIYGIKIKFSAKLARGLSYYTGNVFEVYSQDFKGSLGGGGRYDEKVGKEKNKKIPAVGIGLGFDRICELAKIKPEKIKYLIISIQQDEKAIKLAENLRKKDISCFVMYQISRSLDYANSLSIPYVIFLGKEEVKKKKIKLRDMKTGEEKMLGEKELLTSL